MRLVWRVLHPFQQIEVLGTMKLSRMKPSRLSQAILWSLAATSTTVQAQEQDASSEERNSKEVDRIVVTATKTEEVDLQAAPITVQAIGAEQ
ncbi:MAG: hypothetical protein ACPGJE_09705, partial [Wenzhouxiangellaceae bacterium]